MYRMRNINTKEKMCNAIRNFSIRGNWVDDSHVFKIDTEDGDYEIHFSTDKNVLVFDGQSMEFDIISLLTDEERQKFYDEWDKSTQMIPKWVKFVNSENGDTKYMLRAKYWIMPEYSMAEHLNTSGRVSFHYAPHRNLHFYLTADEDGNLIKNVGKIYDNEPVDADGIESSWFENNKEILKQQGKFDYSKHSRENIKSFMDTFIKYCTEEKELIL